MASNQSVVDYRAEHEGYRCGYCHSPDTNFSHGMWAHQLTVEDYQDLIDRGWRRGVSGKYTYKPTLSKTCCPMYPIRCTVSDFTLCKSHKKLIKRVNNFLNYGRRPPNCPSAMDKDDEARNEAVLLAARTRIPDFGCESVSSVERTVKSNELVNQEWANHGTTSMKVQPQPGMGRDPNKPPQKKAKLLRLERKLAKQAKNNTSEDSKDCTTSHVPGSDPVFLAAGKTKNDGSKSLEDYLDDVIEKPVHKLELLTVRVNPRSPMFDSSFNTVHSVYEKYQTAVHEDPPGKPSMQQFTRFLVDSPLCQPSHLNERAKLLPCTFGSYHQHYILDGKIIAVGVIDVLPRCVSSVYLFYDPDYSFLSLGTYSALRELAFTRSLCRIDPEIQFYYLGYYIHSCPKMRYKGQYKPSYLCCPETYKWYPIEECQIKLDVDKYSRFAPDDAVDDDQLRGTDDLRAVLCLHQGVCMPYGVYLSLVQVDEDANEIEQYATLVGRTCSQRMLLCRR